jgi:hypothetical protein
MAAAVSPTRQGVFGMTLISLASCPAASCNNMNVASRHQDIDDESNHIFFYFFFLEGQNFKSTTKTPTLRVSRVTPAAMDTITEFGLSTGRTSVSTKETYWGLTATNITSLFATTCDE